jgi:hypothetical protein
VAEPVVSAIKAGLCYFALTFGAGFLLGPLRILLLVPRVGARAAELAELPVMIVVMWLAARWTIRRFHVPSSTASRLAMGVLAFTLLLAAEFLLVLPLRGLTLEQYFATRDPVSGVAYYASLVLLALMPLIASGPSRTSLPRASSQHPR